MAEIADRPGEQGGEQVLDHRGGVLALIRVA
jgi:hypothetical protein